MEHQVSQAVGQNRGVGVLADLGVGRISRTPRGGVDGCSCKVGSSRALPAWLLSHAPHATSKGAGVGESQVSWQGVGGKHLGHVGATAPSHPSYSLMLLEGEAAGSRQKSSHCTVAIRLDWALPCSVLHLRSSSPDVPAVLSSPWHCASPAEQLQGWPQPCSQNPSGFTAGWVMVCPFGRALPESAFHLASADSCSRRDGPKGAGFLVLLDLYARLSLLPMGSINPINLPAASSLLEEIPSPSKAFTA